MYLFFNGVSTQGYIALFGEDREIIASQNFQISGNESTKTIPIIDDFLFEQNIEYKDIQNIVTVVGPGSFTGIRTISLVVNTLAYVHSHIFLTSVNFFDLYTKYPIIKSSSKRDLFVKYQESDTIGVVKNDDFISEYSGYQVYGDSLSIQVYDMCRVNEDIDYENFIRRVTLEGNKKVSPLYIKKPNIS